MESTDTAAPFESLFALRSAHTQLLREWQQFEDEANLPPPFLQQVEAFLQRGEATGRLVDIDEERSDAQTLLNYWTTVLYGAGVRRSPAVLQPFDAAAAAAKVGPESPYRGLEPFEEDEASLFFGRHRLIRRITSWLADHRFVVIAGLSGTGKSSLVRAGVIPALRDGAVPGSEAWRYLPPIVPGSDPLTAIAGVTQPGDVTLEAWRQQIAGDPRAIVAAWQRENTPVLLTIDQFEELFTLVRDEAERARFIAVLEQIATAEGPQHRVVLAMRSDFESFLMKYPAIERLVPEDALVRLSPLDPAGLRQAIEKPAARRGVVFEAGLPEELIHQVVGEPAGLPLLQFALLKLWERRDGRTITWKAYKALGGNVRDILTRAAEETYESFTLHEDRAIVEAIFQRLVQIEGGEVTSRRVARSELMALPFAAERIERVLGTLVSAGLLRVTSESAGDARVEITHEALIRNWERLESWIGDVKEQRRKRAQFRAAMDWWIAHDRHPSGLLRGVRLAEAEEYADLTDDERAYVKASRKAADRERNRILVAALTVLSVVVVLLGGLLLASRTAAQAMANYREIEERTRDARARYDTVVNNLKAIEDELVSKRNELDRARAEVKELETAKQQAELNYQQTRAELQQVSQDQAKLEGEVQQLLDVRPTIPVEGGRLLDVPAAWRSLEQHAGDIARASAGVGLMQWRGGGSMATAFVAAPGVVVTFAQPQPPPPGSVVDFADTPAADSPLRFEVTEVIGADRQLGIALVRVQSRSSAGRPLPRPLPISRGIKLQPGSPVYVLGFPSQQNGDSPRQMVQRAMTKGRTGEARPAGKRVQPGYILSVAPRGARYTHDCYTSAGNSGSPVIELETGRVIGFHYGGEPATPTGPGIKQAIGFWGLVQHPLIAKAGVRIE